MATDEDLFTCNHHFGLIDPGPLPHTCQTGSERKKRSTQYVRNLDS